MFSKISVAHVFSVLLVVLLLSVSAIEVTPAHAATFTVTNLSDSGAGSLRQAVIDANAAAGADTITFSVSGTIPLGSTLPNITDAAGLTVDGAGQTVTISGGHIAGVQVFVVDSGASLTLNHLTIADSNFFGYGGGGVSNSGALTIMNSTFSGNSSSDLGGGVWNAGTATITNSAFSGNSSGYGGGISNSGTLTVTNSTFSGNSAYINGSGIANTFTATLRNTIVANSAAGGNCIGEITNGGNNIDSGTTCGLSSASGSMSSTDPLLGALASNGGYTQTFALLAGSPAIDGVTFSPPNSAPSTDQRGIARPQGVRYDIGSYEYEAVAAPPTVLSVTRADANPTSAASVHFTVTFSEAVTGVDTTDFTATMGGGVSGAAVSGFSGSGSVYTVTVTTGIGSGTLRLDVVDNDSILNVALTPLGGAGLGNGNFTTGEVYSVRPYLIYLPLVIR